jgi:acetolactate synthase I/II/III large subunit
MNCAQVLIEGIIAMGAKRMYGVIGTSTVPFVNALYDYRENIRYVSCRHEQVAASMADAEGRITGVPGVALTHAGPGTVNALISACNAYKDCSPLIILSGAVKRKLKGSNGILEIDQQGMYKTVCKGVFRIEDADKAQTILAQAYTLAISGARGPVLIEVPQDVWEEELKEAPRKFRFSAEFRPPLHIEDVWDVLERLKAAAHPVLLFGGGIAYAEACDLAVKFAEAVGAPVLTTCHGRGTIPEHHKLCLGVPGFGGGNVVADTALEEADLVVGIGCLISDNTTYDYTLPIKGEIVLVNIDLQAMLSNLHRIDCMVEADAKDFITEALAALKDYVQPERPDWWKLLEDKRKERVMLLEQMMAADKVPLSPARVMAELVRLLSADRIITAGSGTHLLYAVDFIPCLKPLTYLSAINFGAMGFAFPAALGAKMARPEAEVVSVIGDGDFMMTAQDLETACREGIKVRVLVINDYKYGVLNLRQRIQYQGRVLGTEHGNPDFAALARSFGAGGWRLERVEDIVPVLSEALACDGPAVVDVIVDPKDTPPLNLEALARMTFE